MKILFVGGDSRMKYTAETLGGKYDVTPPDQTAAGKFDVIVLPLPLKKLGTNFSDALKNADKNALVLAGGNDNSLTEICVERGFKLVNYFSDEVLTLKNAMLTAEAAVGLILQSTPDTLRESKTLITGYGRIAKYLARLLAAFGTDITVAARRKIQRETALLDGFSALTLHAVETEKFDFIANTVPAPLFSENDFAKMHTNSVFIELASLPAVPPQRTDIKYIHAGGLPGKYSPKAAGKAIAETLEQIITDEKITENKTP